MKKTSSTKLVLSDKFIGLHVYSVILESFAEVIDVFAHIKMCNQTRFIKVWMSILGII